MNEKKSRTHKLTRLEGNTIPRYMIFVDTETLQNEGKEGRTYQDLRLGVAVYWTYRPGRKNKTIEVFRFTEARLFWEFVSVHCVKGSELMIFAHNAIFDMTVLHHIKWLEWLGYRCSFIFDNAMTFIAEWKADDHTIKVLNTANWFHGSVAKWGDELGLEKLLMPPIDASNEEWFVYCERDTMVIKELVAWYIAFLQDNNLGAWRYTIASQAFTAFRHRFMRNTIIIPDNETETELARRSYHGGRTECFKQGVFTDGPYFKIDVNSMYPYVMLSNPYPTKLVRVGEELTIDQAEYIRGKYGVIVDCTVCTPIPFFVDTSTGRNVYPVGTFRTVLTTNEFFRAVENRWVQQVHSYAMYSMRNIFKSYIDFFYALKVKCTVEGKRLQRAFTKLYLNSLYGKFGQRGYFDEEIGRVNESGLAVWFSIDAETGETYLYRLIGHSLIRSSKKGESWNSFCAIASHVTANARLVLYDTLLKVGRDHCYYCDTDSLIVDATGYMRIQEDMDDTRLGAWALEGESDTIVITAPKHYWFDGKWTRKGIRKDALQSDEHTFTQEVWPGLNTIIKSGKERYYNYLVTKRLSPVIETGSVMPNGDIQPLVMGNERMDMGWYHTE